MPLRRDSLHQGLHHELAAETDCYPPGASPASIMRQSFDILRLVTYNVDGLGSYPTSPGVRMGTIVDGLLSESPDVILFQEVVAQMYVIILDRLRAPDWKTYRRKNQESTYFVVTAVRVLPGVVSGRTTSHAFASSEQGRHVLTVRVAGWSISNVHAESGCYKSQQLVRRNQIEIMSRFYQQGTHVIPDIYVLAGDFNMRPRDDDILLEEGWWDAWVAQRPDQREDEGWTWPTFWKRGGPNRGRFDRVYVHHAYSTMDVGHRMKRLESFSKRDLSDHVALLVVLQRRPRAESQSSVAERSCNMDDQQFQPAASLAQSGRCQQSSFEINHASKRRRLLSSEA